MRMNVNFESFIDMRNYKISIQPLHLISHYRLLGRIKGARR